MNAQKTAEKERSGLQVTLIGLKLLLICAIIAGLVSFVFSLTNDVYLENLKGTKELAVGRIFTGEEKRLPYEKIGGDADATVSAVYDGDALLGYCVEVTTAGFGGDIELMIGYNADQSIRGVEVVGHTETPGLGSKSADKDYLSAYKGLSGELAAGDGEGEIDMISGASVTSGAVLAGVNRATASLEAALAANANGEGGTVQ